MKLTQEDIKKYGTKDEILFLEGELYLRPKRCARCGKKISQKMYRKNGRLCDMCEEDIALGRDRE